MALDLNLAETMQRIAKQQAMARGQFQGAAGNMIAPAGGSSTRLGDPTASAGGQRFGRAHRAKHGPGLEHHGPIDLDGHTTPGIPGGPGAPDIPNDWPTPDIPNDWPGPHGGIPIPIPQRDIPNDWPGPGNPPSPRVPAPGTNRPRPKVTPNLDARTTNGGVTQGAIQRRRGAAR